MEKIENVVTKLKDVINLNGTDFLENKPYQTYTELMKSGVADRKTAGAILYFLVNGLSEHIDRNNDIAELSKIIQKECSLNKKMSDHIAEIFTYLYSDENKQEWKSRDKEGLKQFLNGKFSCKWTGFSVWYESNGSISCHYSAEIVLSPTKAVVKDTELTQMLEENPFLKKKVIGEYFEKKLKSYLADKFEEYCTCDEYYEPVVEDFYIDDCVEEWCEKNGFKYISCDGSGYDDGYEPN